jgi:hypothetical protein
VSVFTKPKVGKSVGVEMELPMMDEFPNHATALDQLKFEDTELRRIFDELDTHRKASVQDRADYGILVKQLIRHLAIREAALVDLLRAIESAPSLQWLAERMKQRTKERRTLIDRIEHMSRGVQGINLNTGQDLDAVLLSLEALLESEMQWELAQALPVVGAAMRSGNLGHLHSARHVIRHAPTNLDPGGPRWHERAPVVSRVLTIYDHLRDFPRASTSSGRSQAR